jgi:hypothetical protein
MDMTNDYTIDEVLDHPKLSDEIKMKFFEELFGSELTEETIEHAFKVWRSNNIKSSNVKKMAYDDVTRILTVQFNDRSIYTYYDISFDTYMKLNNGEYSPRTSGSNEYGSWEKGVRPSTGAGIWQALIDTGVKYTRGGSFK